MVRPAIWLAFGVLLISSAATWALDPHDKAVGVHTAKIDDQQKTENQSAQAHPDPAQTEIVTATARDDTKAAQERQEDRRDKLRGDTITGIVGTITFLILCIQTYFFRRQAQSLRDTITAMQNIGTKQSDDMQKSTIAAQAAAEAGNKSADLARLALEAAETPYLVPIIQAYDDKADPPPPSPAMKPLVSLRFENVGRSPATVLEIRHSTFGSGRTPEPAAFPPAQINLRHSYILAPNRESDPVRFTVGSFYGWTPANQHEPAWISGHLRYADVFGNQFLTGFCYYRNGWGHGWHAQGGPRHNYRRKLNPDELKIALERDGGLDGLNGYPGG